MPPESGYQIPDQSFERSRADLYAYYRQRIDEEAYRRTRRGRIIDVSATRVSLDEGASASRREAQAAFAAASDQAAASNDTSRASQRPERRQAERSQTEERGTYAYRPASESTEIELRPSPAARGMIIDLMA